MGRKAKLKKIRKQQQSTGQISQQYDSTQFVKQFEKMGYKLPSKDKIDPASDSMTPNSSSLNERKVGGGNRVPEIPQEKIEPQL